MNGTQRDWLYFLVDGIYVRWSIFVKPRQAPADAKENLFNSTQEAARKCVERGFGQLVAQFEILKNPIRKWHMDDIKNILYCCIIVHNMVTAERRSKFIDADVMPEEEMEAEGGGGRRTRKAMAIVSHSLGSKLNLLIHRLQLF